jgi:hypothetical protein
MPSTIANAKIMPQNKLKCLLVFDANIIINNCVLSANSARATSKKGIKKSVNITYFINAKIDNYF